MDTSNLTAQPLAFRPALAAARKLRGTSHIVDVYEESARIIPELATEPTWMTRSQTTTYLVPGDELSDFSALHGHRISVVRTVRDGKDLG